jgi:hypothetical protein
MAGMPTQKKQPPEPEPEQAPEPETEPTTELSHAEQERLRRWLRDKFH